MEPEEEEENRLKNLSSDLNTGAVALWCTDIHAHIHKYNFQKLIKIKISCKERHQSTHECSDAGGKHLPLEAPMWHWGLRVLVCDVWKDVFKPKQGSSNQQNSTAKDQQGHQHRPLCSTGHITVCHPPLDNQVEFYSWHKESLTDLKQAQDLANFFSLN